MLSALIDPVQVFGRLSALDDFSVNPLVHTRPSTQTEWYRGQVLTQGRSVCLVKVLEPGLYC
jgi:hypothetical protein